LNKNKTKTKREREREREKQSRNAAPHLKYSVSYSVWARMTNIKRQGSAITKKQRETATFAILGVLLKFSNCANKHPP
jgi:hypothetical protein